MGNQRKAIPDDVRSADLKQGDPSAIHANARFASGFSPVWARSPAAPLWYSSVVRRLLLAGLLLTPSACFDSDELGADFELPDTTTRGTKPNTEGGDETETEDSGPDPDLPIPDATCRDAVQCIIDCAADLPIGTGTDEVDLSCFFDCEEGLTVDEALQLVRLGACVFNWCTANDFCEATPDDPLAPLNPQGDCLLCVAAGIGQPDQGFCESEFMTCD